MARALAPVHGDRQRGGGRRQSRRVRVEKQQNSAAAAKEYMPAGHFGEDLRGRQHVRKIN